MIHFKIVKTTILYYFNMRHPVASGVFEMAFGLPAIDHLGIMAVAGRIILKVKLKEITCQVEDWAYLALCTV
jgi:hypothetical protein